MAYPFRKEARNANSIILHDVCLFRPETDHETVAEIFSLRLLNKEHKPFKPELMF